MGKGATASESTNLAGWLAAAEFYNIELNIVNNEGKVHAVRAWNPANEHKNAATV
jgi:hypothetical protein